MEMNRKILASVFIIGLLAFAVLPPALAQPSLALNPSIGPSGTIVAVSGSGFAAGVHRVYFDTDGDGSHGSCEPFKYVFVGALGTFTTTLTVPPVPSGAYFVRADVWPYTAPAIASAPFTVKTIFEELFEIEGKLWSWADSLKNETKAIEVKLDGIIADIGTWPTAHFTDMDAFADWLYGELITDIAATGHAGWTDLASALNDIKTELTGIIADIGTWPTPNFLNMGHFADWVYGELFTDIAAMGHGWTGLAEALDDIKDELGQGLVGEHEEWSITLTGLTEWDWEGHSFIYDGGKKLSFYIDTSNMNSTCTIEIEVCMDVDGDDDWASPDVDVIEDALTGKAYHFTFSGVQTYNNKLIVNQLPISRRTCIWIRGTAGLVIHYHWILEEV